MRTLIRFYPWKPKIFLRAVSTGVLICFITTQFSFAQSPINPREPLGLNPRGSRGLRQVILLQDAHSLPEAQRSIAKIIEKLQEKYGVKTIALEGVKGSLDPQLFKAFPDQEQLKKFFNELMEKGEVTGPAWASIFSLQKSVYQGIESWPLYEAGLRLYLLALKSEPELLHRWQIADGRLQEEKKKVYSKKLLAVDSALQDFHSGKLDFLQTLKALEINRGQTSIDSYPALKLLLGELREEEKGMTEKEKVLRQKRLKPLEGSRIFKEFHQYTPSVKESLFRNDEERRLDQESRQLELLRKLSSLELTREEWEELKIADSVERLADRKTGPNNSLDALRYPHSAPFAFYKNAEQREEAMFQNLLKLADSVERLADRKTHPKDSLSAPRYPLNATILITGGFHTRGLTRKLKAKGISYTVIQPKIDSFPKESIYRDHMKGHVSWKKYFEIKNGRINLYEAFVRAARDRLLGVDGRSPSAIPHLPSVLKPWRDQIIRDLASQEKITQAGEYTQYLDELTNHRNNRGQTPYKTNRGLTPIGFKQDWIERVGKFIQNLKHLEAANQFTEQNILKLLQPSNTPSAFLANALAARAEIRADILYPDAGGATFRSELRQSVRSADSASGPQENLRAEARQAGDGSARKPFLHAAKEKIGFFWTRAGLRSDGTLHISLNLSRYGEIQAEGKTSEELAESLAKAINAAVENINEQTRGKLFSDHSIKKIRAIHKWVDRSLKQKDNTEAQVDPKNRRLLLLKQSGRELKIELPDLTGENKSLIKERITQARKFLMGLPSRSEARSTSDEAGAGRKMERGQQESDESNPDPETLMRKQKEAFLELLHLLNRSWWLLDKDKQNFRLPMRGDSPDEGRLETEMRYYHRFGEAYLVFEWSVPRNFPEDFLSMVQYWNRWWSVREGIPEYHRKEKSIWLRMSWSESHPQPNQEFLTVRRISENTVRFQQSFTRGPDGTRELTQIDFIYEPIPRMILRTIIFEKKGKGGKTTATRKSQVVFREAENQSPLDLFRFERGVMHLYLNLNDLSSSMKHFLAQRPYSHLQIHPRYQAPKEPKNRSELRADGDRPSTAAGQRGQEQTEARNIIEGEPSLLPRNTSPDFEVVDNEDTLVSGSIKNEAAVQRALDGQRARARQKKPTRSETRAEGIKKVLGQYQANDRSLSDQEIDELIGLRIQEAEELIKKRIGKKEIPDVMDGEQIGYEGTHYRDIRHLFNAMREHTGEAVVYDLGSGYGRLPIYGGLVSENKGITWKGIELVPERVQEAQRVARALGLQNVQLIQGNVINADISDGDLYYLFNPFTKETLNKVIGPLKDIARNRQISIAARGPSIASFNKQKQWLKQLGTVTNIAFYQSRLDWLTSRSEARLRRPQISADSVGQARAVARQARVERPTTRVSDAGGRQDRAGLEEWPPKRVSLESQSRIISLPFSVNHNPQDNAAQANKGKSKPQENRQFFKEGTGETDGQNRLPKIGNVSGNELLARFIEGKHTRTESPFPDLSPPSLRDTSSKVNNNFNLINNINRPSSEARKATNDGGGVLDNGRRERRLTEREQWIKQLQEWFRTFYVASFSSSAGQAITPRTNNDNRIVYEANRRGKSNFVKNWVAKAVARMRLNEVINVPAINFLLERVKNFFSALLFMTSQFRRSFINSQQKNGYNLNKYRSYFPRSELRVAEEREATASGPRDQERAEARRADRSEARAPGTREHARAEARGRDPRIINYDTALSARIKKWYRKLENIERASITKNSTELENLLNKLIKLEGQVRNALSSHFQLQDIQSVYGRIKKALERMHLKIGDSLRREGKFEAAKKHYWASYDRLESVHENINGDELNGMKGLVIARLVMNGFDWAMHLAEEGKIEEATQLFQDTYNEEWHAGSDIVKETRPADFDLIEEMYAGRRQRLKEISPDPLTNYLTQIEERMNQEPWEFFNVTEDGPNIAQQIRLGFEYMIRLIKDATVKRKNTNDISLIENAAKELAIFLEVLNVLKSGSISLFNNFTDPTQSYFQYRYSKLDNIIIGRILTRFQPLPGHQARVEINVQKILQNGVRIYSPQFDLQIDHDGNYASLDLPDSLRAFTLGNQHHYPIYELKDPGKFSEFSKAIKQKLLLESNKSRSSSRRAEGENRSEARAEIRNQMTDKKWNELFAHHLKNFLAGSSVNSLIENYAGLVKAVKFLFEQDPIKILNALAEIVPKSISSDTISIPQSLALKWGDFFVDRGPSIALSAFLFRVVERAKNTPQADEIFELAQSLLKAIKENKQLYRDAVGQAEIQKIYEGMENLIKELLTYKVYDTNRWSLRKFHLIAGALFLLIGFITAMIFSSFARLDRWMIALGTLVAADIAFIWYVYQSEDVFNSSYRDFLGQRFGNSQTDPDFWKFIREIQPVPDLSDRRSDDPTSRSELRERAEWARPAAGPHRQVRAEARGIHSILLRNERQFILEGGIKTNGADFSGRGFPTSQGIQPRLLPEQRKQVRGTLIAERSLTFPFPSIKKEDADVKHYDKYTTRNKGRQAEPRPQENLRAELRDAAAIENPNQSELRTRREIVRLRRAKELEILSAQLIPLTRGELTEALKKIPGYEFVAVHVVIKDTVRDIRLKNHPKLKVRKRENRRSELRPKSHDFGTPLGTGRSELRIAANHVIQSLRGKNIPAAQLEETAGVIVEVGAEEFAGELMKIVEAQSMPAKMRRERLRLLEALVEVPHTKLNFGLDLTQFPWSFESFFTWLADRVGEIGPDSLAISGRQIPFERLTQKGIKARPADFRHKMVVPGLESLFPVASLGEDGAALDPMYLTFTSHGIKNVDDPILRDHIRFLQLLGAATASALIQENPTLATNRSELRAELLKVFGRQAYDKIITDTARGFDFNPVAARLALEHLTGQALELSA